MPTVVKSWTRHGSTALPRSSVHGSTLLPPAAKPTALSGIGAEVRAMNESFERAFEETFGGPPPPVTPAVLAPPRPLAGGFSTRLGAKIIKQRRATMALDLAVSPSMLRVPPLAIAHRGIPGDIETLIVPARRCGNTLIDNTGSVYALGEVLVRGAEGAVRHLKKFDPVVCQFYAAKEISRTGPHASVEMAAKAASGSLDPAALKQLRERLEGPRRPSKDTQLLNRADETQLQNAVRLPIVLKSRLAVHYILRTEDRDYLVMPAMDGDLIDAVNFVWDEFPAVLAPLIHDYAFQTAQQLAMMHQRGVVHRDIKLENVLYGCDGTMEICDFGHALEKIWVEGLVGTPGYIPPEAYLEKSYDGRKADMFALGCAMIFGLLGRIPFDDETLWLLRTSKDMSFEDRAYAAHDFFFADYEAWYRSYESWVRSGMRTPDATSEDEASKAKAMGINFGHEGFDELAYLLRERHPTLFPIMMPLIHPDPAKRPTAAQWVHMLQSQEHRLDFTATSALRDMWMNLRRETAQHEEKSATLAARLQVNAQAVALQVCRAAATSRHKLNKERPEAHHPVVSRAASFIDVRRAIVT